MIKKFLNYSLFLLIFLSLSSMEVHKFYTSIYQINYVPQKKMIQITSRIFIDDLNQAIAKRYKIKCNVGTEKETPQDVIVMQKYLAEKFILKVNGISKPMSFRSKEIETNVLICYFRITDVSKISKLEIENSVLTESFPEQQNIIQANISGEKQSLLLTSDNYKGMLK